MTSVVRSIVAFCMALVMVMPATAYQPDEVLKDPGLEARARALSAELRCLVCQNQSIDDSDAPLARDLRILVRERLAAGDTDRQVIDFVVARYGEFVLLRPRFGAHTLALWLGPLMILLIGGFAALAFVRRARSALPREAPAPLSAEEAERVARLLSEDKGRQ